MALQQVSTEAPDMRILVIEDDADTAAYMVKGLKESGYVVDHAADGRDGMFHAMSGNYDALIVDRMLPNVDGLSIIQAIRTAGIKTPALILSALGAVDDRVKGRKRVVQSRWANPGAAGVTACATRPNSLKRIPIVSTVSKKILARRTQRVRGGCGSTIPYAARKRGSPYGGWGDGRGRKGRRRRMAALEARVKYGASRATPLSPCHPPIPQSDAGAARRRMTSSSGPLRPLRNLGARCAKPS